MYHSFTTIKEIKKPFSQVTKEYVKKLFEWMKDKEYKASTHEKYRVILKIFYKVVYGNNEVYPDCVKWFSRAALGFSSILSLNLTKIGFETCLFLREIKRIRRV